MENIYFSAVKMLLALAAMVFVAIVFYRYMGKWRLSLGPKGAGYGLQKMETVHLGYKKFVSVIEVKNRVLVVGVGEKEMALLTQWNKEEGMMRVFLIALVMVSLLGLPSLCYARSSPPGPAQAAGPEIPIFSARLWGATGTRTLSIS